jgi:hypothetical protein
VGVVVFGTVIDGLVAGVEAGAVTGEHRRRGGDNDGLRFGGRERALELAGA